MNLKGYASTQSPVPISVQNMVIRDYCARHGHDYSLSDVEFMQGHHVLLSLLQDFDGICAYSMGAMPELPISLRDGQEIHFALEGYFLPRDREMCETVWRLKSLMA